MPSSGASRASASRSAVESRPPDSATAIRVGAEAAATCATASATALRAARSTGSTAAEGIPVMSEGRCPPRRRRRPAAGINRQESP